ncbi:MAG: hypothetical protein EA412_07090 [Chitinophagaceae bacterium]|nr:MAG: hypothetical protein EA412_07090 [Chitinophagaceae bacterium]
MELSICSKAKQRLFLILLFLSLIFGFNSAQAQEVIDITGPPFFGRVNLNSGFSADPHTISIISGGEINAEDLNLCSECKGYISDRPDY